MSLEPSSKSTRCAVCQHARLAEIEKDFAAGLSLRTIASKYEGLSAWSVRRHAKNHMEQRPAEVTTTLSKAAPAAEDLRAAVLQVLQESVACSDFVRRRNVERIARTLVAMAVGGKAHALGILCERLWPTKQAPTIGELVVANQIVNAGDEVNREEAYRRLGQQMREIYSLGQRRPN